MSTKYFGDKWEVMHFNWRIREILNGKGRGFNWTLKEHCVCVCVCVFERHDFPGWRKEYKMGEVFGIC